ncbi:glycosyltransferase [Granulosicoccus sp.]|nr:glycosyltransferase [Granulosicoccus sp.]
MKVIQLASPTGFYGAERWIVALARNLDSDRIKCELVVTSEDSDAPIELLEHFPEYDNNIHRLEMRSRFDFAIVKRIASLVEERGVDIIHSHGYKSDVIALLVAHRCSGLKTVSTPHGFGKIADIKLRLFTFIGRLALRRFDAVVPLSRPLEENILASGVSRERVRYIANGVDLSDIHADLTQSSRLTGRFRIGYVGRLAHGKQIDHLLEVFDMLWRDDSHLTLEIAGEGVERERLEARARTLPSAHAISFLGFVEDRFKLMRELDLFVMTSESEGIPRCLMEAHVLELPIAAYDIEGVDQLVCNGKTGLLAPLGDRAALASRCRELLDNPDWAAELAANGRRLVEEKFSAERMAHEYTSLYENTLCR